MRITKIMEYILRQKSFLMIFCFVQASTTEANVHNMMMYVFIPWYITTPVQHYNPNLNKKRPKKLFCLSVNCGKYYQTEHECILQNTLKIKVNFFPSVNNIQKNLKNVSSNGFHGCKRFFMESLIPIKNLFLSVYHPGLLFSVYDLGRSNPHLADCIELQIGIHPQTLTAKLK